MHMLRRHRATPIWQLSGPAFDAATTAWVNAVVTAGGTVSTSQKGYVDTLIKALKTASVWTSLSRLWLLASENTYQAGIDIVGLNTYTNVNYSGPALSFTADSGLHRHADQRGS